MNLWDLCDADDRVATKGAVIGLLYNKRLTQSEYDLIRDLSTKALLALRGLTMREGEESVSTDDLCNARERFDLARRLADRAVIRWLEFIDNEAACAALAARYGP